MCGLDPRQLPPVALPPHVGDHDHRSQRRRDLGRRDVAPRQGPSPTALSTGKRNGQANAGQRTVRQARMEHRQPTMSSPPPPPPSSPSSAALGLVRDEQKTESDDLHTSRRPSAGLDFPATPGRPASRAPPVRHRSHLLISRQRRYASGSRAAPHAPDRGPVRQTHQRHPCRIEIQRATAVVVGDRNQAMAPFDHREQQTSGRRLLRPRSVLDRRCVSEGSECSVGDRRHTWPRSAP